MENPIYDIFMFIREKSQPNFILQDFLVERIVQ